ncbi:MAG: baseplate J/gp47 family protein [Gammaproteobacteria bacterium]|uniref:Putative baseplate protein n=1 Tax=viral metagenome TaxID=1070528 RepID=A0A6M3KKW1_9ZZZZ|nr:baseplate J/gp47 family protein [Gammaproteobacteria bacterium]MBU1505941.1 baseplate J/gp47 family protein [Gammaproteobacteria bacterium]MBU2119869.1 baseplate J/gp47 family protein [Gammaproteobacteria bacterium]MBU2189753.1 baseplate J/gp47 family protein [Gammaproteobacteria bacterium]
MSSIPDLAQLPAPNVVEALDYETILGAHRADLLARYPAAADVIALESEPLAKLLQAHAYRELLYRQRVNDAARAYLLAYATGADLDHKGAFYGLPRLPGEADERYRVRIQLRIRALAGNGTREHYELVALTASPNVRDAIAMQPWPGSVRVQLWLHDTTTADATQAAVLAALNADGARPLGVPVSVSLARPRAIHITAALTREPGAPTTLVAQLQAALPLALAAYARLGRAVPRSWVTTRLHVEGIAAVRYPDAAAPAELTPMADDEYPVLGALQLVDEGVL